MICSPPHILIEKNEIGGELARMGEMRGVHGILVGKP